VELCLKKKDKKEGRMDRRKEGKKREKEREREKEKERKKERGLLRGLRRLGCSSMVEHVLNMCKALDSIPKHKKQNKPGTSGSRL
jgi:hypothetical protein